MADQVGEAMRCYICREGSNPIQSISHSLVAVAVAMSHSPDRLPPEIVQEGEEEEEGEEHAAVDEHLVQVLAVLDHPHDRSRETQRVAHIQQLPVCRLDERKHRGMRYRSSTITTTTKAKCDGVCTLMSSFCWPREERMEDPISWMFCAALLDRSSEFDS